MSMDRDTLDFLALLELKRYEDVIAALAAAIKSGWGQGLFADLVQRHGFLACKSCRVRKVSAADETCEYCVTRRNEHQAACPHPPDSKYDSCRLCGLPFLYCHICSGRPTATKPVYHAPPVCSPIITTNSTRSP